MGAYPALHLQQPQIESPLDSLAKVAGVKNMMQQSRMGDMQVRQQELAMKEQEAFRQAITEAGGDVRKAMPKIMQVAPQTGMQLQKQIAEWEKSDTETKIKKLELEGSRWKQFGELAGGVTDENSKNAAIDEAVRRGLFDATTGAQFKARPYDPAAMKQFQTQAMTVAQQIAAEQEKLKLEETGRHNRATEANAAAAAAKPTAAIQEFDREYGAWLEANGLPKNAKNEMAFRELKRKQDADTRIRVAREGRAPVVSSAILSAEETKAAGLPSGTVAQRGANGKIDIVYQPKSGRVTGSQSDALRYFLRAKQATESIEKVEDKIAGMGVTGQARLNWLPNIMQTDAGKLYNQATRSFTEARLRDDSGAAIANHEYENDRQMYFAQPGDTPEVLRQKREARATALEGMAATSGPAFEEYYGEAFKPGQLKEKYGAASPQAGETKSYEGYEYVKQADGTWKRGRKL